MTSPMIYKQMALIMADIAPIAKSKTNASQGYKFRGIDEIYQGVQQVMAKHSVVSVPEVIEDRTEDRTTKSGSALIYRILKIRYTFYAEDGSSVPCVVIGEGMDSGDKASNKAMSVAEKYSLIQVFKIPTAEPKDPENDSHDLNKQLEKAGASKEPLRVETHSDIPLPEDEPGSFEPERQTDSRGLGSFVCTFGKYKGKSIDSVPIPDWINYLGYLSSQSKAKGESLSGKSLELYTKVKAYAESNQGNQHD